MIIELRLNPDEGSPLNEKTGSLRIVRDRMEEVE